MKSSKLFLWLAVIIGGAASIVSYTFMKSTDRYIASVQPASALVAGARTNQSTANFIINDGAQSKTYHRQLASGQKLNGLEFLQQAVSSFNWTIEKTDYSFGALVTSINGIKNGTDGKNWSYYVNGSFGQTSLDNYAVQPNDTLEMRFEKSSY